MVRQWTFFKVEISYTTIIVEAQDFKQHGKVRKSFLHSTMNIKYWLHFLPKPLSTIAFSTALFSGWSLVLADRLTTMLWDLEDHPLAWISFELTSWMRTSSKPSQEQSTQNRCLCVQTACVLFASQIYTFEKFCLTPNFPNSQYMVDLKCYLSPSDPADVKTVLPEASEFEGWHLIFQMAKIDWLLGKMT